MGCQDGPKADIVYVRSTQTPPVTRLAYCPYLRSSQINSTWTNFADHREQLSHAAVTRSWAGDRLPPRLVWENVQTHGGQTDAGSLVCAAPVVAKHVSRRSALVRRPDSGHAHGSIKGLGVVPCV